MLGLVLAFSSNSAVLQSLVLFSRQFNSRRRVEGTFFSQHIALLLHMTFPSSPSQTNVCPEVVRFSASELILKQDEGPPDAF